MIQKGVELGLFDSNGIHEKACILALTLDNLSNYPMIGIQLDVAAVWKQTIMSVLAKKEGI
ncbi:hypothetical protein [Bacillus toyonensis]|uniref:hypothetical protein n=1 Tax=Bacillus toyonensis TaxID=155322 RepID=UPI0020D26F37|nr:hypothetical protein [Bacillus toyonensis]